MITGLSFPITWHRETRKLVSKLRDDIIHENVVNLLGVTVIDGINYAVLQNASKVGRTSFLLFMTSKGTVFVTCLGYIALCASEHSF